MRGLAILLLSLAGNVACSETRPAHRPVETPEQSFVFDQLSIEERRDGRKIWSGTAAHATGDLSSTQVTDVKLHCTTHGAQPREYDFFAPRAQLELDDGNATFEEVRVVDAHGATLNASLARYTEQTETVSATGPLVFTATGLTARATSAFIRLESGEVVIEGPVEGRFEKRRTAPPSPTPDAAVTPSPPSHPPP